MPAFLPLLLAIGLMPGAIALLLVVVTRLEASLPPAGAVASELRGTLVNGPALPPS